MRLQGLASDALQREVMPPNPVSKCCRISSCLCFWKSSHHCGGCTVLAVECSFTGCFVRASDMTLQGLSGPKLSFAWCRLHNFVNGVDVVPRMLGNALDDVMGWVYTAMRTYAAAMMIQSHRFISNRIHLWDADFLRWKANLMFWVQSLLANELKPQRTSYLPLGLYHMLLGDQLQTVDTASQQGLMRLALFTTVRQVAGILPPVRYARECVKAHNMDRYRGSLARVFGIAAIQGQQRTFHLGLTKPASASTSSSTNASPAPPDKGEPLVRSCNRYGPPYQASPKPVDLHLDSTSPQKHGHEFLSRKKKSPCLSADEESRPSTLA